MGSAARLRATFALLLALVVAGPEPQAVAIEKDRLVPAGRLVIEGRRLSCGSTKTLLRDFEGFAVSSTVIMLNMQALNPLPRQVQWLIYYHECGHILLGQSETVRRLLCGQARAARGLAQRPGAQRRLRGVQYRRPRARAPRPASALRSASPMLRQEGRDGP